MDFIYTAQHAMPDSLCDELIDCFNSHPGVEAGKTSGGVDPAKKSSLDLTIERHDDLRGIRKKILDCALESLTDYFLRYPMFGSVTPTVTDNVTGATMELNMDNGISIGRDNMKGLTATLFRPGTINIQRYLAITGGYPRWHSEIFPDESFEALHRIVFWMFYLNDVESGGETEFYFQKLKIKPTKGTVVIAPAGFTHTHRGNVPLSGDKYIVTSWLLYGRAGKLPGQPA